MELDSPAHRLRWARENRTQYQTGSDAARAFGWAISTYLGHENGDRNPSLEAAKRYAAAYKVPWTWILEGGPLPASAGASTSAEVAESFGAYIRNTRETRGISLQDFAKLVGVHHTVMSRIEGEDWKPKDDMLRKIARTLGVDGDDLVARSRRVPTELADFVNDPGARPIFRALLRTTKDLPPEELAKAIQQLAEKATKSKP